MKPIYLVTCLGGSDKIIVRYNLTNTDDKSIFNDENSAEEYAKKLATKEPKFKYVISKVISSFRAEIKILKNEE